MNLSTPSETNSSAVCNNVSRWFKLFLNSLLSLGISLIVSNVSFAEDQATASNTGLHCNSNSLNAYSLDGIDKQETKYLKPRAFPEETIGNTEISADFTRSGSDGVTSLNGNVIIERHLLRVTADHAQYDNQQDVLDVSGNIHIDAENISMNAASGSVNIKDEGKQSNFNNIQFLLPAEKINDSNIKGKANIIISGDEGSKSYSTLENAAVTSCDLLDPDWLLSADKIRLNHSDEYGSAKNVVMRFKNIPFLYLPYIEFPISDKRRSGLLFPEIGTSTSRGVELTVPWYWNIAPNHDAIIAPRFMAKRGVELSADYRFLTKNTTGNLAGAYLHKDDITKDQRYRIRYTQRSVVTPNLLFNADLEDISDTDYFTDFANSTGSTTQTHLYRNASFTYGLNNWQTRLHVQDIETIDTTSALSDRPYKRLPQLTIAGDTKIKNSPFLFTFDSELVNFDHENDVQTVGTRLNIRPGLRLPLKGTAWFFDPAIKFSHSQYNISTESGLNEDVDNRNLIMSSIDAGLFFERNLDNGYQHTLEPRLYYLNVPFEAQSDTPLFDTSNPEFNVAQLFRDNRFVGGDRIGDANQITLSLTSRVINPKTGNELLRASIGQIFYFKDREVSLDNSIDTAKQSDIIAEFDTHGRRWQTNVDLQWDTTNNTLAKQNYFYQYKSDARHLLNLGYRKRLVDNILDIEQTDTSFVYSINSRYVGFARWNYSLIDNRSIDNILGVAYNNCCWSLQVFAQRKLLNSNTLSDAFDNSVLVQFVLKGLGSLSGAKARMTLEQSIYGYTDPLK